MDISQISTVQPIASTQSKPETSGSSAVLSSDFETFLKMLTAQARYQDPLEPIDSSEYAAQLAQFSMVEQQVMSNDLLAALGSQLGSGNMAQLAGWIGMDARTTAPVKYDGAPITLLPSPAVGADQAFLIVRDSKGNEVDRAQIEISPDPIEWVGTDEDGTPLPSELYNFTVESRAVGQVIDNRPAESYARIKEARRQGAETLLILEGDIAVSTSDVSALRESI